ncbi:MAG: hypothetical protein RIM80_20025 [Alphaproteobacteria bacterium]
MRISQGKSTIRTALLAGAAACALAIAAPVSGAVAAGQDGAGKGVAQSGSHKGAGGKQSDGAGGQMRGKGGKTLNDIFRDVTGESEEDSDRPSWAGQPGGKDGAGGGKPATSASKKGDLFGDLFVILRDSNGVPILTPEGFVQPLDANGDPIPLDAEGAPIDETLAIEVELGRLNVGRAPTKVLDRRAEEVITLLNQATDISLDAAGRLVLTVDGVAKTIDSPLENLAIYVSLLTTGSIPGVSDLPGDAFDFMVDGVYTVEDLKASASFLAAATDKTGVFTSDEIAYIDAFLGINTTTTGSTTYSVIDYSTFSYDRSDTYGDVTANVLIEQADGSFVPTEINVYDVIFNGTDAAASGTLDAYTQAADDARAVIEYIHEFAVPVTN